MAIRSSSPWASGLWALICDGGGGAARTVAGWPHNPTQQAVWRHRRTSPSHAPARTAHHGTRPLRTPAPARTPRRATRHAPWAQPLRHSPRQAPHEFVLLEVLQGRKHEHTHPAGGPTARRQSARSPLPHITPARPTATQVPTAHCAQQVQQHRCPAGAAAQVPSRCSSTGAQQVQQHRCPAAHSAPRARTLLMAHSTASKCSKSNSRRRRHATLRSRLTMAGSSAWQQGGRQQCSSAAPGSQPSFCLDSSTLCLLTHHSTRVVPLAVRKGVKQE